MRNSWSVAVVIGLAAVGIGAAEPAKEAAPQPERNPAASPAAQSEATAGPGAVKPRHEIARRTAYRDVTMADGRVVKQPYAEVVYSDREVPTDQDEITSLREELKRLNQKRIDSLNPAALLEELDQERARAHSQEGWDKL